MKPSRITKIGCGCLLMTAAFYLILAVLCLALIVWWGNRLTERQERLLVRYSPETAEALCEHFGWNGEAFCSQPNLQNARELNDLLDARFPPGATYYDVEPYVAALPSVSHFCTGNPELVRLGIGHCLPPDDCQTATDYSCNIQLPLGAGAMTVWLSAKTGRIISIGVGEYPESM